MPYTFGGEYLVVFHDALLLPGPFAFPVCVHGVDIAFDGPGYIAGTVSRGGSPTARPVRLYDRRTGVLVAETMSAADGSYRFDRRTPTNEFFVLAFDDPTLDYNLAGADRITPAAE